MLHTLLVVLVLAVVLIVATIVITVMVHVMLPVASESVAQATANGSFRKPKTYLLLAAVLVGTVVLYIIGSKVFGYSFTP